MNRHATAAQPISWRRSWREFITAINPPIRWGLAAAAALLLLTGGWLVADNFRLRGRLGLAQDERAALQPNEQELLAELERQRSARAEIENELKNLREQISKFEQGESQKPAAPKDLAIVHFELSPQTRSIDQITTISIPPGTDYVSFQLELEPGENHRYRAELKSQSDTGVIWRSGKLNSRLSGKSRVTNIRIPASLLKPSWYILELAPYGKAATEAEAGYPFRVD
jgi:hypothetical protein